MGSTTSIPALPPTGSASCVQALRAMKVINVFPTITHAYYALGRALLRGDSHTRRPPIPIELVLQIFENIPHQYPSPNFTVHSRGAIHVYSRSPREEKLFFCSEPVTRRFLNRVVKMRLDTVSKDQGWVGNRNAGSWTWFEIGILRPVGNGAQSNNASTVELNFHNSRTTSYTSVLKSDGTGDALRWTSHRNVIASRDFHSLSGEVFGPDHEIWDVLVEGDVICVYACAMFGGWENKAQSGRLMMWEKFDPMTLLYATD